MKRKINIKTGISILLLVLGLVPLYSQEISNGEENEPFHSPSWTPPSQQQQQQLLKAPGAGGPDLPPPTEDDKVGGAPIRDALWVFPLFAVSYGIYAGRKQRHERWRS